MSAECSSCGKTCRLPDFIWYAGTKYDWNVWWVCGSCVDQIPLEDRHLTSTLMDFEVTFGRLDAETNERGVYQGMTSKQAAPEFSVRNDALARYVPGGQEFVDRFYPFNDLESHLKWLAKGLHSGELPGNGDRNKLLRDLTLLGPGIERFLNGPGELSRKNYLPFELERLNDLQILLAEDLLTKILMRDTLQNAR